MNYGGIFISNDDFDLEAKVDALLKESIDQMDLEAKVDLLKESIDKIDSEEEASDEVKDASDVEEPVVEDSVDDEITETQELKEIEEVVEEKPKKGGLFSKLFKKNKSEEKRPNSEKVVEMSAPVIHESVKTEVEKSVETPIQDENIPSPDIFKAHSNPVNDVSDEEKKTILIVEDEAITAMDLRFTLEDLGYKVIATVDNGYDAIDTAAELCPDLTIMDINLKGEMSGIEAAEKILEFDLPVIYLTANSDDATFSRAIANSSAYAFIPKPFDSKIMKHNIDFAINRAGIESEKINLAHGFVDK